MLSVKQWWADYVSGRVSTLADLGAAIQREKAAADAAPTSFERFAGTLTDGLKFEAPQRLAYPSLMTDEAMLKRHGRADWQHVHPGLMEWAARFVEAARRRGIPLYVHAAFRTRAEQEAVLAAGTSKARWPRAPHCIGEAVDVVHGAFHWSLTDQEWRFLGKLGFDVHGRMMARLRVAERWGLVWGGDEVGWRDDRDGFRWDPAHWEVADWRARVRPLPEGEPRRLTPRGILALP